MLRIPGIGGTMDVNGKKSGEIKIRKALDSRHYAPGSVTWAKHTGWVVDNYPVGFTVEDSVRFIKEWWVKEEAGNCFADPERWIEAPINVQ